MKELLKKLIEAEKNTNKLDEMWENDSENEELENKWNEAYKNEWHIREQLIETMVKATGLDEKTIRKMLSVKRTEVENLIMKMA